MHILVLNCGSSSVKLDVVDHLSGQPAHRLRIERVGEDSPELLLDGDHHPIDVDDSSHRAAVDAALEILLDRMDSDVNLKAVGHRVVHGGDTFKRPRRIDDELIATLEDLTDLAPLHNPINLAGIEIARKWFPDLTHIAVFDTAFHATLPSRARAYALPAELRKRHDLKRYGFHGISHRFVAKRAASFLDADLRDLRLITCHLGNGASLCAVEYGRSIETSMGLTPLEGLVMGSRSGDVDPGILIQLMRQEGLDVDELDHLLNHESGLRGLSDHTNDMRDIEERASNGDDDARLASQVFAHRLRKYIGAYAAVMGGVDAIVFTGGIGENSALIRHRVAQRFQFLGAHLDEERNRRASLDAPRFAARISTSTSRTHLIVAATDESRAIAERCSQIVMERDRIDDQRTIPIAVSARHLHLRQETIEQLFGPGHELTPRNDLSQPGQYAAEETVRVIGPKGEFQSVRILGPARNIDQLEISRTDEFHLGVDAPVRASGDIDNTPGIILEGPEDRVKLERGVICAWRHIHMTPDDATHFGVKDRDVVEVAASGGERDLVFGDVLVRVSPDFQLEMHIDTDEANAANLASGTPGNLISTNETARLRRRKTAFDPIEAQH